MDLDLKFYIQIIRPLIFNYSVTEFFLFSRVKTITVFLHVEMPNYKILQWKKIFHICEYSDHLNFLFTE